MLLNRLAKYHAEWVEMALKLGAKSYAEDMVQEMYLRLNKYVKDPDSIMYGDEPNKLFIWITLRNLIRTHQGKKTVNVEWDEAKEYIQIQSEDLVDQRAFDHMVDLVYQTSEEMHWYNDKLFKLYYQSDLSMRDISKGSKISLKNIFDTIKKTRNYVKEKLQEDYQDYQNKDYELIRGFRRYGRKDN